MLEVQLLSVLGTHHDGEPYTSLVGFAATAVFRADAPPAGGDAYGSIQRQIEMFEDLPGPAVVVTSWELF